MKVRRSIIWRKLDRGAELGDGAVEVSRG